ncbi:MAG: sulfotransferase [Candidatus Lokiarchaeota archaeon]|nr:sulfotransferase [Candidatus Lokiarchaeota archaeon]
MNQFDGPLFVVGMQRSGTKLLRDLLNQNKNIGIPKAETNFLPYILGKYQNLPQINDSLKLNSLYEAIINTTFYRWMNSDGFILTKNEYEEFDFSSWLTFLKSLISHFAPPNRNTGFIWGDKSPNYVNQILFLKNVFPSAKFIHIIRDPRDCCLSSKKVWGKNLYRTAEIWRKRVQEGMIQGKQISNSYSEILYEELLNNPEKELKQLCNFIGVDFHNDMLTLKQPSENLGDTIGKSFIVKTNVKKFQTELSPQEIKRIEEVVYPVMTQLSYEFIYDVKFKPLNPIEKKYYLISDEIFILKHFVDELGYIKGVKMAINDIKEKNPVI